MEETREEAWDAGPTEQPVATFRDGQLTLTSRRVVYRGRGLARHDSGSIRLRDVTATGVVRRFFRWRLLVVPFSILLMGFTLALMYEDGGPFVAGLIGAAFTLPLPFFAHQHHVAVASSGLVLYAPVGVRHIAAAREFLEQVETLRDTVSAERADAATLVAPTTRPYGR